MDRQRLIQTLAETQEDRVLLARIWDRFSAGQRKNIPMATCFLSGREQILARRLLEGGGLGTPVLFGGYPNAERRVAAFVPDYYEPEEYFSGDDGPVAALRIEYSAYDSLSHRDFLGGLMGQGIKRESLGDLLPGRERCDVLVLRELAGYLAAQVTQVGRASVRVREIALAELEIPEQRVKTIAGTVASLRLDSVVSTGFQVGRTKAAELIRTGRTEVNHIPVLKPDGSVAQEDVISVRGLGKLRVAQIKGQTKKGRMALILEKYL